MSKLNKKQIKDTIMVLFILSFPLISDFIMNIITNLIF